MPRRGIVCDVSPDEVQRPIIANDVIVESRLPAERCVDAPSGAGDGGLIRADDVDRALRRCVATLGHSAVVWNGATGFRVIRTDPNDGMHVIRHHDHSVHHRIGKVIRNLRQTRMRHTPDRVQPHHAAPNLPEQMPSTIRADRDEIPAGRRVIVIGQPSRPAMGGEVIEERRHEQKKRHVPIHRPVATLHVTSPTKNAGVRPHFSPKTQLRAVNPSRAEKYAAA